LAATRESIGELKPSSAVATRTTSDATSLMRSRSTALAHALGGPGRFDLLADRVDLILQLEALFLRLPKLLLDQRLVGLRVLELHRVQMLDLGDLGMHVELGHEPRQLGFAFGERPPRPHRALWSWRRVSASIEYNWEPSASSFSCSSANAALRSASSPLRRPIASLLLPISASWFRGLALHLLDAHLQPPRRDRDLRMELIHIGLDIRHQRRRGGFETLHGAMAKTRTRKRLDAEDDQDSDEGADPEGDDGSLMECSAPIQK